MGDLCVAIACESDDHDAVVYRRLLELLLGRPIERWRDERTFRFYGHKHTLKLLKPYLADAMSDGVQHALIALDNDGGSKKNPEHTVAHHSEEQAAQEVGCRFCKAVESVPRLWTAGGNLTAVGVPVQALETWLLCVRQYEFGTATPERQYDRRHLKRALYGSPLPPAAERASLGVELLGRDDAVAVLRSRLSFRLLESQLAAWR